MSSISLLIIHTTKNGQRDVMRDVWLKYMASAIQENPGHVAYFYTYDKLDSNRIYAFQEYASEEAARQFLEDPRYKAYVAESREYLDGESQVIPLAVQWKKETCAAF